jgi:hypothetical protein
MLQVEPKEFFRLAHIWKFGRDVDTSLDGVLYIEKGEIPPYVRDYVRDIQQKERG